MNTNRIQELIDLYWKGTVSAEDEKEIQTFLASNTNLPTELEKWRDWFAGKDAIGQLELGGDFDEKILSYLEQDSHPARKPVRIRRMLLSAVAAAAVVILVVAVSIGHHQSDNIPPDMTYTEVQESYETIKELLYLTATKMNETETLLGENLSKIGVMNEYIK